MQLIQKEQPRKWQEKVAQHPIVFIVSIVEVERYIKDSCVKKQDRKRVALNNLSKNDRQSNLPRFALQSQGLVVFLPGHQQVNEVALDVLL